MSSFIFIAIDGNGILSTITLMEEFGGRVSFLFHRWTTTLAFMVASLL